MNRLLVGLVLLGALAIFAAVRMAEPKAAVDAAPGNRAISRPVQPRLIPDAGSGVVSRLPAGVDPVPETESLAEPTQAQERSARVRWQDPEEVVAFEEGGQRGILVAPGFVQVVDLDDVGGQVQAEGGWLDGKKHGFWQSFENDGLLASEGMYVAGLANGLWKKYAMDGSLIAKANLKDGRFNGACYFYTEDKHAPERVSGLYEKGELKKAFEPIR